MKKWTKKIRVKRGSDREVIWLLCKSKSKTKSKESCYDMVPRRGVM